MLDFFRQLPEEILLKILNKLPITDLGRVAQVSHADKQISEDDFIWKKRTTEDFHFTDKSAEDLKKRLQKTYKQIYQYCVEYELNFDQGYALKYAPELQDSGLTKNHLCGREWFNTSEHGKALIHLVRDRNFTVDQAMVELDELNWEQADGISKGLTRNDVIGLTPPQISALAKLKKHGLTASHMHKHGIYHSEAFIHLVRDRNFTVDQAMAELDGLDWQQIDDGICKGLTRDDVIGLTPPQISALAELKKHGLTADHLRGRTWFIDGLGVYQAALRQLILERNFTADEAMAELNGLNRRQADGIWKGLTRNDVTGLTHSQILALAELKDHGLTASHLRSCRWWWFDESEHRDALTYLMLERNFTVDQALAELDGLNAYQAEGVRKGLTRADVTGLSDLQILTLIQLKDYGLTASHLRSCRWPDDSAHGKADSAYREALTYLIKKRNFTVDQALAELDGLNVDQARGVSKGLTRIEVTGLNSSQILALIQLKDYGLTPSHLYSCEWLNSPTYQSALSHLVKKRKFTVDDAMTELDGLNWEQADGIRKGLTRNDVTGLTDSQILALAELKDHGLTADHLRGRTWFDTPVHWGNFTRFIFWENCSVDQAMKEMDRLNSKKAEGANVEHPYEKIENDSKKMKLT